jgi:membrane protease YdiL (CAAX protease family)
MDELNERKYDLLDGIAALFFVIILFFGYVFILNKYYAEYYGLYTTDTSLRISQNIFAIIYTLLIAVYLLIRKQPLSSIGLSRKNLKNSFLVGLYYSVLFTVAFLILHLIKDDFRIVTDGEIILKKSLYFVFFVALFEEFVFRGFINSRLRGLVKNKYLAMIVASVLFSLLHMPFNSMYFAGSFGHYLKMQGAYHLILCFLHLFFTYLFNRYQNLAASTVFHFVYNFIQWLFLGT